MALNQFCGVFFTVFGFWFFEFSVSFFGFNDGGAFQMCRHPVIINKCCVVVVVEVVRVVVVSMQQQRLS